MVGDQRLADCQAAIEQQRKDTFGQAAVAHGLLHCPPDQFGCAGMGRMRFRHDRTAGRQRGRGIAARDREGQRKIACAEYRYRAQRDITHPQIGTRLRLAFGLGRIDSHAKKIAGPDHVGEQAQLAHRAAALALDARTRQSAFGNAALNQRVAQRHDVFSDFFEKGSADFQRCFAVDIERVIGQSTRLVKVRLVSAAECRLQFFAACGVDAALRSLAAADAAAADEHFALYFHIVSFIKI